MRCGEKSYIWRRARQFALSLGLRGRNGFARAVKQPPNATLKRNLEAHRNNLRKGSHHAVPVTFFLKMSSRGRGTEILASGSRRAEMDRFTDTPVHAAAAEAVLVPHGIGSLAHNLQVAA
jgi:hypothetical protein